MKRRTGEMCSKWPRRTVNRSRGKLGSVAENVWWCSPGFVYIRVLSFWAFVLVVDFLLEFRLELLWPLWLLLTSVYDSFKYQGLAFSVFFVCLSLTADFLCFLFIPVQWLFFVAPTYVWIQYVWHTERGICLPTICLWVLFIYVEASIRLKDLKHFPGHLDLCRPFAAHCIGYPVVTWGFDIKGYVSYRIRQRKQREVAKENEFYYELLVQSLPAEQQEAYHLRNSSAQQALSSTVEDLASVPLANGSSSVPSSATCNSNSSAASAASKHVSSFSSSSNTSSSSIKKDKEKNAEKNYEKKGSFQDFHEALDAASLIKEKEKERGEKDKDKDKERDKEKEREKEKEKRNKLNNSTQIVSSNNTNNAHIKQRNNIHSNSSNEANTTPPPSEHVLRLEADIKRLKADLQASRQSEAELRSQLAQLTSNERSVRAELSQSQQDNDSLQAKLHGLVSARQSDKQTMASLEKRLQEERKCRMLLETQLANERRNRANDVIEATKAQQRSKSTNGVGECGENCRQRRRELEMEVQQLRRDNKSAEDRLRTMDLEIQHLRRSQQTTTPPQQQQQQLQQQQHQQQQLQQQQHQQQQHQQQQHQQQQLQQQQLQQQQQQHQHQQQQHQHQQQQHQQQHQHQQHNVETELLVSALAALQDKTSHLESSLSAETRLKLDLFSALGEAKRQLEHRENLLLSREREISELKAKVTEVLAVMPTLNDSSQLGHNMGISDLNNHGLGSMGSLSSYLSTYPLSMTDLGLSSNLNLGDLNLDHGSSSPITLTPSSPLTPMRPYTSKLFNHANGGPMGVNMSGGNGIDTDKGSKPGSNLDPNATAYTPKAMGNGDL